ncbi:MAG: hypothetical protein O2817_02815 [Proteobacteria bacterium]|nr:hypothetical protein [Pseudomonadota bacterium]
MSALFLIATMISLTACSLPVSIDADCAWAKPIRFSELTKNWLSTLSPWPEPVRQDFEKIAKHNDKHRAFCG